MADIQVADAIVTEDGKDLQFKIITTFEDGTTSTVLRSHHQILALHTKFSENLKTFILPSIPEAPNPSYVKEPDNVEKKKTQIQRYLTKLVKKEELWKTEDLKSFLSQPVISSGDKQTGSEALVSKASTMMSSLGNVGKFDNGIRIFKPANTLDDDDDAAFEKRKMYILQSEKDYKTMLDAVANVVRARNGLGRQFLQLGTSLSELEIGGEFGQKKKFFNELGIKMNTHHHDQVREEVYYFADVILEYRNNSNVKTFLNNRTELLFEYDQASKALIKSSENLEKLKKKFSESSPEYMAAADEREKLREKLDATRQQYEEFKQVMLKEEEKFEKQKVDDFQEALGHFVKTQIDFEGKKLEDFNLLLNQLRA